MAAFQRELYSFFCLILLAHKGSHWEFYWDFQPQHYIIRRWCQGLLRQLVPCTPSLHCPLDQAQCCLTSVITRELIFPG